MIKGRKYMNRMNFVFLETYCLKNFSENQSKALPDFCSGECVPGYSCLIHQCPYLDFTSAENAFAYIGKDSSSKEEILLSSDADLSLWERICRRKINEAWEEYVRAYPESDEPKQG